MAGGPCLGTIFSCDAHPLSIYSSHQLLISLFYGGLPWEKFHNRLCKWPHHPASCSGQKNVLFTLLLIIHSLVVLTSRVHPRRDNFDHHCHHPSEEPSMVIAWRYTGLNLSPCIHAFFFFCSKIHTTASQIMLVVKNLPANTGDVRDEGLIPGLGRSLGGGQGNPLQYSCLEDPMERGAWQGYQSMGSQRVGPS